MREYREISCRKTIIVIGYAIAAEVRMVQRDVLRRVNDVAYLQYVYIKL